MGNWLGVAIFGGAMTLVILMADERTASGTSELGLCDKVIATWKTYRNAADPPEKRSLATALRAAERCGYQATASDHDLVDRS